VALRFRGLRLQCALLDPCAHRSVFCLRIRRLLRQASNLYRRVDGENEPSMTAAVAEQIPVRTAPFLLRRAAVLGAGSMGSRIAAHLGNGGVPVLLLDIVPPDNSDAKARSSIAARAVGALLKAKPASFYDAASAQSIMPGNFEDNLAGLKDCDWIIEA